MIQQLDTVTQELDVVTLTHDIQEHGLKTGDRGAVVHRYPNGQTFEVEFVRLDGKTTALLTLHLTDIQKVKLETPPEP
jgi:hypothetical protein